MRFLLAFVLSFVSLFAIAQAPPMVLGGPQGINVTKALVTSWLSVPTYADTPTVNPGPGPSPWPGKGYVVQVVKSGDTSIWQYTGRRWARIGGASQELFTRLISGGNVSKIGSTRDYVVSISTYIINGVNYVLSVPDTVTSASKTPNANGRIDVITLTSSGAEIVQGTEASVPIKPSVGPNRIELSAIYYRAFDTVPSVIGSGITSVFRKPGVDSLYFSSTNSTIAVKDSIGVSGNDTASMLNNYKFTAANGLTKDSTVFRLGGSLNQNTNINLNTRRLTIIGGVDTTRFFSNGRVSIGGTPDSTYRLNVNGTGRFSASGNTLSLTSSGSRIFFGNRELAIGEGAISSYEGVALGWNANADSLGIAIGKFAKAPTNTIVIGNSQADIVNIKRGTIRIGASNLSGIAIGGTSTTSGDVNSSEIAIGSATATGAGIEGNIAIGRQANANGAWAIALGAFSKAEFGEFVAGAAGMGGLDPKPISNVYFGSGKLPLTRDTIGFPYTINGSGAKGTNFNGGNITIAGGKGTGNATPGSVIFSTSSDTTSGTALQTLKERARITPTGNLLVGTTTDVPSSKLTVTSTTQGFLQPRMTNTQRDAISTPAQGLQIFSTTDSANYVYRGTGGGWQKIANEISGSATLDFPSTGHGNSADLTFTLTGAAEGDVVALGIPNASIVANGSFIAWVSATDTITVRFNNYASSGSSDPANGTFKIKVFK